MRSGWLCNNCRPRSVILETALRGAVSRPLNQTLRSAQRRLLNDYMPSLIDLILKRLEKMACSLEK